MGNFYTNVVVRGPSEDTVADTLLRLGRACCIASRGDFVFVYDLEADKQRPGVVESLALTLATQLHCPALAALNHDDDVLLLWLYDETGGELRFGWGKAFDDTKRPAGERTVDIEEFIDQLRHVFATQDLPREPDPNPLRVRLLYKIMPLSFAFIRHERILREARIPVRPAMAGYNYVYQGELESAEPELKVRRL
jgi:hypothetical protein